ncbi:MAG: TIGR03013 family PEP-CTERM/XrtA system glycosyltransferase [Gammaproteobacteria bacterium]|nr:TIGR03013 family PEP-CTERM/XrtA system glycosyltransferase [Gammaproteobacteria bacterium]
MNRRVRVSNVDPGYLNKNAKALFLFESILIILSMAIIDDVMCYLLKHYRESLDVARDNVYVALLFVVAVQLISLSLGLYSKNSREEFKGIYQRICLGFLLATCFTILFFQISVSNWIGMMPIIVAATLTFFILCYLRYQLLHLVVCHSIKRRVLVLGSGKRASVIESRTRREADRRQFDIHAYIKSPGDEPDMIKRDKVVELTESLSDYILNHHIEQVVVAYDERRNNLPVGELTKCKLKGVKVVDILTFIENETGQIAIDLLYPDWIIYSEKFGGSDKFKSVCHWAFNSVIAVAVATFGIPIMIIAIIAIKIEDGIKAPVFYLQTRIGAGGRYFKIIKLRSMTIDAEKNGATWAEKNDSRITKVGQVIRQYRIDELPQLLNVLKGDMGFVGPRPERPEFVEQLASSIPFYNERHHVKPGLTGWAQIRYPYGASQNDAFEKLKFDFYYIKNRSYLFDLFILLRTTEIILFSRGVR